MYIKQIWILIIFCFAVVANHAQDDQSNTANLFITNTVVNNTADVTLDVIVTSREQAVIGLNSSNFVMNDVVQNTVTISPKRDTPIAIAIIADMGQGADTAMIQDVLNAYIDNVYQDGDTVIFYPLMSKNRSATDNAKKRPSTADELRQTVNALSASPSEYPQLADALVLAFRDLSVVSSMVTKQVLVVSTVVNAPNIAEDEATRLAQNDILVHVIQAHDSNAGSTSNLRSIASSGRGFFVEDHETNRLVSRINDRFASSGALEGLFNTILNNRTRYTISYTSGKNDTTSTRQQNLTVNLTNGETANASYEYNPHFLAPQIQFVDTSSFNVIRDFDAQDNLTTIMIPVKVRVTFPDGIDRPLNEFSLRIADANNPAVDLQPLITAYSQENNNYVFNWSLDSFITAGSTTNVLLEVSATDVIGQIASVNAQGSVGVDIFITNTPVPTNTPVSTNTPIPTNTPVPTPKPQSVILGEDAPPEFDLLLIVSGYGLVGVLGIAVAFLTLTRTGRGVVQQATKTTLDFANQVASTMLDINLGGNNAAPDIPMRQSGEIIAQLHPIKGLDFTRPIDIGTSVFQLGRTKASGADVEIKSPIVSGIHFAIRFKNTRLFFIEDLGSTNHTYLDGQELAANKEYPLKDGQEIRIGQKLIFRFEVIHIPGVTVDDTETQLGEEFVDLADSGSSSNRFANQSNFESSEDFLSKSALFEDGHFEEPYEPKPNRFVQKVNDQQSDTLDDEIPSDDNLSDSDTQSDDHLPSYNQPPSQPDDDDDDDDEFDI